MGGRVLSDLGSSSLQFLLSGSDKGCIVNIGLGHRFPSYLELGSLLYFFVLGLLVGLFLLSDGILSLLSDIEELLFLLGLPVNGLLPVSLKFGQGIIELVRVVFLHPHQVPACIPTQLTQMQLGLDSLRELQEAQGSIEPGVRGGTWASRAGKHLPNLDLFHTSGQQ